MNIIISLIYIIELKELRATYCLCQFEAFLFRVKICSHNRFVPITISVITEAGKIGDTAKLTRVLGWNLKVT